MARRPAVKRGQQTTAHEDVGGLAVTPPPTADPWEALRDAEADVETRRASRGGRWRGSGGRWWVWVGRAILWAVLLVILVNGIRAPFERFTASGAESPGARVENADRGFPTSAASAYALQFADVYLNYDQETAGDRERRLQRFLPEGADAQFGWNGVGRLNVESVQVAGVKAQNANNAVVTVLARSGDKWFRLEVPVYSRNGAFVISGRPALLPPPARAALPENPVGDRDTALETELQSTLGTFFTAYAVSDQATLDRFSARGSITGLDNAVGFVAVREVVAPAGATGERTVKVRVAWQIPATDPKAAGAELDQLYELTVVRTDDGEWDVRDIRAVTEPTTP